MCQLREKLNKDTYTGFKVVFTRDDGKRFSPATGLCYNSYRSKDLPMKPRSSKISAYFNNAFLDPHAYHGYTINMVGRSAVLKHREHAEYLYDTLQIEELLWTGGHLSIVEATVSKDLMKGRYGSFPVVAGKRIRLH